MWIYRDHPCTAHIAHSLITPIPPFFLHLVFMMVHKWQLSAWNLFINLRMTARRFNHYHRDPMLPPAMGVPTRYLNSSRSPFAVFMFYFDMRRRRLFRFVRHLINWDEITLITNKLQQPVSSPRHPKPSWYTPFWGLGDVETPFVTTWLSGIYSRIYRNLFASGGATRAAGVSAIPIKRATPHSGRPQWRCHSLYREKRYK